MNCSHFFDLLARIIRSGIARFDFSDIDALAADSLDAVKNEVYEYLEEKIDFESGISHDQFRVNSSIICDTINWIEDKNDKYIYIIILMLLCGSVNVDRLCMDYGISSMIDRNSADSQNEYNLPYFKSLNNNCEETGIVLIPDLRTDSVYDGENPEEKTIVRMSTLNDILHNIRYIELEELRGYRLNNVIINPIIGALDRLKIGFTPTTGKPKSECFKFGDTKTETDDDDHKIKLFGDFELVYSTESNERFLKSLEIAGNNGIGILIGTEAFGTEEMIPDNSGMNLSLISDDNKQNPFLILTPSVCKDKSNVIYVYSGDGELIGMQYKQFRFSPDGLVKEDLRDTPKEILVIHIKGLGKITLPICADLLNERYRNVLVRVLKTDFLICESYSRGSKDFERVITGVIETGAYALWCNSCSAVAEKESESKCIGCFVAPTEYSSDAIKDIYTDCEECKGCLFSIEFPTKREGRIGYIKNDIGIERIEL